MWCEKLPSGKYRFIERYIVPMTGETKRVGVTLDKNTKQAEKLAREIQRQKMELPAAATITFGEFCDMYLSDQKPILKPST